MSRMRAIKPIRIDGEIAYVPLSRGCEAIIDATDVSLVGAWNWYANLSGYNFYASRNGEMHGKRTIIRMHRFIMNFPEGFEVDHKNGNTLDNRRENLRVASKSQNMHNTRKKKANKSSLKGAYFRKDTGKWFSVIMVNRNNHRLGQYETAQEAHEAYCQASIKLHGEFSRTE